MSATTYTLVGVINKFLTILLNVFLWDKHASGFGLVCVCMCLGAGVFYQQAPKRTQFTASVRDSAKDVELAEEKEPLRGSSK